MYAIVEIAGQQFKVERGNKVYVHRLDANEGAKVEFDKVFLIDNDGKISIGSPTIDGARVAATVIEHLKGDKVIIFKKLRRKGYQKWNNHRQYLTQIIVQGILTKGETLKDELKAEKSVRNFTQLKDAKVEVAPVEKKVPAKASTSSATKKKATKKAEA
jgi:large subunit ribosomal protein L21